MCVLAYWTYKADYAQSSADTRKKIKPKHFKFNEQIKAFIKDKIQEEWSPEQISGYAKRHSIFSISHERIYWFILSDKQKGGNLYKHLRHQHKKYRKRYGSPKRHGPIKNRRFIDERPAIVAEKQRIGDWEIDTIIGKNHKQVIVSIVERRTKKTVLAKVKSKHASLVSTSIINSLTSISDRVFTITGDNGVEFAHHEKISRALNADFYFAHPYSSWERGLNENTNGLIRQYLKKGSDFNCVTDKLLDDIMYRLNNRPRKTLGYVTPNELFYETNHP
ncbi:IS30 family transposase [Legionella pneumophila serogroup 10]